MPEPRIGIIIFARMSSSRLPGKMLRPLGPTTLFDRVVERAHLLDHDMMLATSDQESDDPLVARAKDLNLPVFRGSLDDVLGRAVAAARHAGFDAFCRLCGDRPFMPLDDMQRGMEVMRQSFKQGKPLDLVTTHLPEPVPKGLLTEIIRTETLTGVGKGATTNEQQEHVTTAFYERPSRFRIHELETDLRQLGDVHLSVDTEHDQQAISRVIEQHPALNLPEWKAAEALTGHLTSQQ